MMILILDSLKTVIIVEKMLLKERNSVMNYLSHTHLNPSARAVFGQEKNIPSLEIVILIF